MYTTIKVTEELKKKLELMKMRSGESYEEVIEDLIEDHLALNPEFKKSLEEARKEIKKKKYVKLSDLKKELG